MFPFRFLTAAMVLAPAMALADPPNPSFYLINRSGHSISEVYASPTSAPAWGRDRLDDNTIEPNKFAAIRMLADGNCLFDLKVVFDDGRAEERRRVNTCTLDNLTIGPPTGSVAPGQNAGSRRDPSFRVLNRGNREIDEVYLRRSGSGPWGEDRLGDDVIDAGDDHIIDLPAGQCMWDVKVVYESGQTVIRRRLNLCDVTDLPIR